jgi:hypothetical protein
MAEASTATTLDWPREAVEQLTFHWDHALWPGLQDMDDAEYLWEPVDGMASVRRKEDARDDWRLAGTGAWVVEYPPDAHPSPHVTTIAWRLAHLTLDIFEERLHHHAGPSRATARTYDRDGHTLDGTAAAGLAALREAYERWVAFVEGLGEDGMARPVGPAEGPFAEAPYATLVLHCTREVLHHGAEVLLLRDLYRAKARAGG